MPIDPDKLVALAFPDTEQSYSEKDVMLYALGVGLGHDPLDRRELAFVYEKNLKVLPTFPVVLGFDPFLLRDYDTGVDYSLTVHGEEHLTQHKLPAASGTIVARHRIRDVIDKGAGKGALLLMERAITDKTTGEPIATIRQTVFCRSDGGFGHVRPSPLVHPIPERAPDHVCDLVTRPEMALIYRLSADTNPLHADPDVAKAAGFPRPILQGLGTFGVAGHALLRIMCDYDPSRLRSMSGRFSAPVFPGETIRTEMWRDGDIISYRARVVERDVIAVNHGRVEVN
ncbi:MaoC/PaaZ C-terminal domain-containing protein [Pseudorhodoplanes sinuspersici]|uniref:3-alpha,7-alpha, 12-alpha-trihydroxy-5-beta-cholest-24-enoyl-CoA hydratase n=1 Tax=Pseudorhodoplanes sinuspersici TaxID=1235591 RepID=A0A1W6ZPU7_9HYPH|nr:MaoC/PaaZ C-terminal domain-containing protein [Pseudorhodoplanes sinuspersici]ARP99413.1 3-alpha,7-alpha,12-alpha-trihydroxy-5-beta-cholest-24-enoyl-CoA hydratase [Pseudorhodoplanes sinuspersici]RKE70356.1 acyl dehydratase [Pseudorhodoplanes sinuspersici]